MLGQVKENGTWTLGASSRKIEDTFDIAIVVKLKNGIFEDTEDCFQFAQKIYKYDLGLFTHA